MTLQATGVIYRAMGEYARALEFFNQASSILREIDDRAGEASTLNNIGAVYVSQGRYEKALESYQQAITIWREIDDRAGEGATLNNIGLIYSRLGQYEQALDYYQQSLTILKEIGDRAGEGTTLNNIGIIYEKLGQYEQVLEYFQEALAIQQEVGDRAGEGTTLSNIGLVFEALGQYQEALKYYEDALAIQREIGDRAGEGTTLDNIGTVYRNLGQYEKALAYYQEALAIQRKIGDRAGEATALTGIGEVYRALSDYQQALNYYQQALTIQREIGDRVGEATALTGIGEVYQAFADYEQALAYYQQSLAIQGEIGDRAGEGTTLDNIGTVYRNLGQYEKALAYYQEALAIQRKIGDRAGEGTTLDNIGTVYRNLGQYEQALAYYQEALAIQREIGDRAGEGTTLDNIGTVYRNLGQYEQALAYYQEALAISQEIGNRREEGARLDNLGTVYRNLGQYEQALAYYQKALAISQETGNRREEGTTLDNIGTVYRNLGQYIQALDYYQQALDIRQEIGDRAGEGITLVNIGFVYEKLDDTISAITYYQQALETKEAIQTDIRVEELKASFAAEHAGIYENLINLLWKESRFEEAFNYVERARARAFLDQLAGGAIDFRAGVDATLLEREQELRADIAALRAQLVALRNRPGSEQDADAIRTTQAELTAREADYSSLLTELRLQSPEVASMVSVSVASLADVQTLLDSNTTLVEYFVTDERTLAFIITHDTFEAVALDVNREELTNPITTFRDFATLDNSHPTSLQQLHEWLIAPLKPHLTTPVLGVVPHGVLHYLSFAALTDGKRYLINDHALFTLPSASALSFLLEKRKPHTDTILALGNPAIAEPMPDLRFAQQEVEAIADLYGTRALVGKDATESVVWSRAGEAGVLHLATHSEYNPSNPLFSVIYLASDAQHDGRLQAYEIYGLDLTAATNLVVLSASETQIGKLSAGDEVVGLSRAFMYAGAPGVIASLWVVDDAATALLMERFYVHLQSGMVEAQALRQAQLDVQAEYPHPFYWASFVLTGGYRPKTLPPPSPWPWVGGLGGGLGIVLIAAFFSLSRSSGLPPDVLLRQKSALLQIGLQYRDYRRRWETGTPLERLIVLLTPAEECLDIKQLEQKLTALHAPTDTDQLEAELNAAVRDGLLLCQADRYRLAEPLLARALQAHEGEGGQRDLAKQIRRDHPLSAEARRFLVQAGFDVQPADLFGLLCTSDLPLWTDVFPLYVRLVLERPLDLDEFQALCIAAEVAYDGDLRGHTAAIVIDRPPHAGDLHQIFAIRAQQGLTVVPLPRSLMTQARLDGREMEALREQVELYTGRTDLYDIRAAVTDVLSFFGRGGLLAELQRRLTAGRSAVVFGMRKVGKSSLLGRLREECPWPVALVDLEGYTGGLGYVYEEALHGWRAALQAAFPDLPLHEWTEYRFAPDPAAQAQAFRRAVVGLLDLLADQPGRPGLFLFLDEIDILFDQPEYPEFAAVLRSVAEDPHCRGRFALLAAGLKPTLNRIDRMDGGRNPFYAFFSEIPLWLLKPEDTRTMVISIGGQMGISYEDEALALLVEVGGGHPFLTRQLCSQAVRDLERPGTVDLAQADQAVDDYLRQPRNYLAESLWAIDSGGPPPAEAALLRLLATTQPQPEESLIPLNLPPGERRARQLALEHLHDQSLIRRVETGWELTISLYRRWIRRYILNLPGEAQRGG